MSTWLIDGLSWRSAPPTFPVLVCAWAILILALPLDVISAASSSGPPYDEATKEETCSSSCDAEGSADTATGAMSAKTAVSKPAVIPGGADARVEAAMIENRRWEGTAEKITVDVNVHLNEAIAMVEDASDCSSNACRGSALSHLQLHVTGSACGGCTLATNQVQILNINAETEVKSVSRKDEDIPLQLEVMSPSGQIRSGDLQVRVKFFTNAVVSNALTNTGAAKANAQVSLAVTQITLR